MVSFQEEILNILYEHFKSYPGSYQMSVTDLYDKLVVKFSSVQLPDMHADLFGLERRNLIGRKLTPEGKAGLVWIEPEGIETAKGLIESQSTAALADTREKPDKEHQEEHKRPEVTYESTKEDCPTSLEELLQRHQTCARLIQRHELIDKIREHLTQKSKEYYIIVLTGQPLVGKTGILYRLSEVLADEYVPLVITSQGTASGSLDAFAFDLAEQLTNKVKQWGELQGSSFDVDDPDLNDFGEENGRRAFFTHWNNLRKNLREIAGEKQPVIMIDEIERLLDNPGNLNPEIINLLEDFLRNPENGCFILAGSERIQSSRNPQFSLLIARGEPLRVPYYDEGTSKLVFATVREYVACENEILEYCVALCDGHPRLLKFVFETVVSQVSRSLFRQSLGKNDTDLILDEAIKRAHNSLWALWQRLTIDEHIVIWLISREAAIVTNGLEYSLQDLTQLAKQHSIESTVTSFDGLLRRGIANLEEREWIEWKNRKERRFRFKLGIVPMWVNKRQFTFDEVQRW